MMIMTGGSRVQQVLERRMAHRASVVGILEELAEQRLMRSDFDGFRLLSDRAWRMKMRNFRVGIWMIRQRLASVEVGGAR